MRLCKTVGIIGGNGMLGGAIGRRWLTSGLVAPDRFWIANRSGQPAGFEGFPGVRATTDAQALAETCDIVLLSLPPAAFAELKIDLSGCLVFSVMAGVSLEAIAAATGAVRLVRAMSSPAAELGLAYSPLCPAEGVCPEDIAAIQTLLNALGISDVVPSEDHIDHFTAMTGPVPGFAAFFAACMERYAISAGIDPVMAQRAAAQLLTASGTVMSQSGRPASDYVTEMIDYGGTTAAGLEVLQSRTMENDLAAGLRAAYERTKTIAQPASASKAK